MKTFFAIFASLFVVNGCTLPGGFPAFVSAGQVMQPQPDDAFVRRASLVEVIDGDTVRLAIAHSRRPVELVSVQKVRLKGVRSFELKTPEGQAARAELIRLLQDKDTFSVELSARWSADRQEGILWADGVNLNEAMKLLPQGGN